MKVLAFINLKGGVGKTVSAANFAHILATVHKKRVLLVDGDKQGNASQYFRLYGEQDGTAALLLNPNLDALETVYATEYKGLDIITSNMELYTADRKIYEDESRDPAGALKAALEKLGDDYDYCIIDNGPAVDTIALNVLVAADDVMIPLRPDDFSFSGLVDLAEQVESARMLNPGLALRGAFFTHWQKRETFQEARAALEKSGICHVFQTAISYNPKVSESTFEHEPLCSFAPRSWAAIQYKKLVAEYLGLTDSSKETKDSHQREER